MAAAFRFRHVKYKCLVLILCLLITCESAKMGKGRGSSRGSSKSGWGGYFSSNSKPKPAPAPAPAPAPKPSAPKIDNVNHGQVNKPIGWNVNQQNPGNVNKPIGFNVPNSNNPSGGAHVPPPKTVAGLNNAAPGQRPPYPVNQGPPPAYGGAGYPNQHAAPPYSQYPAPGHSSFGQGGYRPPPPGYGAHPQYPQQPHYGGGYPQQGGHFGGPPGYPQQGGHFGGPPGYPQQGGHFGGGYPGGYPGGQSGGMFGGGSYGGYGTSPFGYQKKSGIGSFFSSPVGTVGTVFAGLALWELMRNRNQYHVYSTPIRRESDSNALSQVPANQAVAPGNTYIVTPNNVACNITELKSDKGAVFALSCNSTESFNATMVLPSNSTTVIPCAPQNSGDGVLKATCNGEIAVNDTQLTPVNYEVFNDTAVYGMPLCNTTMINGTLTVVNQTDSNNNMTCMPPPELNPYPYPYQPYPYPPYPYPQYQWNGYNWTLPDGANGSNPYQNPYQNPYMPYPPPPYQWNGQNWTAPNQNVPPPLSTDNAGDAQQKSQLAVQAGSASSQCIFNYAFLLSLSIILLRNNIVI